MTKVPHDDATLPPETTPGTSPPHSGVTERVPSWRVPDERSSAIHPDAPSWEGAAHIATRLVAELSVSADAPGAAACIVRAMSALVPQHSVAVRIGSGADHALASSRPLHRGETLDRALGAARAAFERKEPFGGPGGFGDGVDGYTVPLVAGTELVGVVAIEAAHDGSTALHEASAAALVLGQAGPTLALVAGRADASFLAHLAWIVEQAPFPSALVDREFVVRAVNGLAARALGTEPADLRGVPAAKLAESSRAAQVALGRLAAGEVVTGIELERRAQASQRIVWVAVPLRDPNGAFAGAIAFGDDRSAVQLLEEQVLHAEKLATVGQLAAGIVHELNNPLTSISVYGHFLLQKAERVTGDPGDVDRLRRIVEASTRMLRFTRDLVTYARPSSEEPSECAIDETIQQSVAFVEHVLTSANVAVVIDMPPGLPAVRAVRGQLHQVFVNLLTNATQAMVHAGRTSGSVIVTGERDGGFLRLRLADDGPGITTENVGRIFEPFFTTKEAGRGTGLGLSIVRNIIQLHGGTIDVETVHAESGKTPTGTTFVIRLPIRHEP